jgi:hypothetical protein
MYISQETYIQKILKQYHMEDCKGASHPMQPDGVHLQPYPGPVDENLRSEYQSIVGTLGYAANTTRADIAFATHKLCQFSNNPSQQHMDHARYVLRYLKTYPDLAICFKAPQTDHPHPINVFQDGQFGPPGLDFIGYSDAAYADNTDNRASSHAYVFKAAGGIVTYKSGKQTLTATSSTEAEYIAMTYAAKEAAWIQQLLTELQYFGPDLHPVLIHGDNKPAISLTQPIQFHARTKHIEVYWHYIRQQVAKGMVKLEYIATDDMVADGLTKPLLPVKHAHFIQQLGLVKMSDIEDITM